MGSINTPPLLHLGSGRLLANPHRRSSTSFIGNIPRIKEEMPPLELTPADTLTRTNSQSLGINLSGSHLLNRRETKVKKEDDQKKSLPTVDTTSL